MPDRSYPPGEVANMLGIIAQSVRRYCNRFFTHLDPGASPHKGSPCNGAPVGQIFLVHHSIPPLPAIGHVQLIDRRALRLGVAAIITAGGGHRRMAHQLLHSDNIRAGVEQHPKILS